MRLDDLLFAEGAPDDLLVHVGGTDHTREDVGERATALACTLVDLGVTGGAPVGVMLPDGADVVAALFGVWRAGGAYVPLNPRLGSDDLAHVMESIEPAAVVTTEGQVERFAGRPVVVVGTGPRPQVIPSAVPQRRLDSDVALVQFTSGTTGRPKPVMLLHSGVMELLDNVLAKLRGGSAKGDERTTGKATAAGGRTPMPNLVPVSLSLWAGIYNVLFALRVGAPVVLMDGGFEPRELARLVKQFEIRSTVLPPAAMTALVDDPGIDDLTPLRFVRSITAPLSPLQARRFRDRFGISVLNSYGQTEIGGEIIGWNAEDSRRHGEEKLGSVGRPHQGVEVRVVDSDGVDVPAPEAVGESEAAGAGGTGTGELWVRTPAMSAGYADGNDLADRLSDDGWFRTGDVGRVDADGFVWIEGRVSDMVNRGGLKVFPAEVEEVLRLLPGVADVAVVGVPDDRLGEVPWAFVVPAGVPAGQGPDDAQFEATCRRHLAPYKVPVAFRRVDTLPTNEVGKVLKNALVEQAVAPA